ncbi:hypothetical protein MNAN1_001989 [Malassezia nana]|uniref:COP9 signalosome complex subunit 6 n=1 Tax=Malassezia nana TaxID=180528 RepID=A0AAF0EI82_9BASI|nr:hypothetical protein MNAN1_001989 [Malassezia nana]
MAGDSAGWSLCALPALQISEHATRIAATGVSAKGNADLIVGALLGAAPIVHASMDLGVTDDGQLNMPAFQERRDLLAQVWPEWSVCGMYALGESPTDLHTQRHSELCACLGNEVPLVLLDTHSSPIRWSVWLRNSATWTPGLIDVHPTSPEQVVLEEADVASYTDEFASATERDVHRQLQTLMTERRSVAALYDRLMVACAYLERVRQDPTAYDAETLRHWATAVAHRAPGEAGQKEAVSSNLHASTNALLASYLAAASKNLHTLHHVRARH